MAQYGWRKSIKYGNEIIELEYNAFSFLIYKNYTGSDMMADIKIYANQDNAKKIQKLVKEKDIKTEEDIAKLTIEEQKILFDSIDEEIYTIFLNILATLIATAKRPARYSIEDIIANYVPDDFITNEDIIFALNEFLSFRINQELARIEKKTIMM